MMTYQKKAAKCHTGRQSRNHWQAGTVINFKMLISIYFLFAFHYIKMYEIHTYNISSKMNSESKILSQSTTSYLERPVRHIKAKYNSNSIPFTDVLFRRCTIKFVFKGN